MFNKVKETNKRLTAYYGTNLIGQSNFRIVFSDTELEKRIGNYTDWYGSIFIREYLGVREVPKYPYIKGKYILERWMPPVLAHSPELPDSNRGSYEPVYIFQTEAGESLPVREEVALEVIDKLFHPALPGHRKSILETEDEDNLRKEIQYNEEVLTEQGRTWIGHRIHSKEAIIVP